MSLKKTLKRLPGAIPTYDFLVARGRALRQGALFLRQYKAFNRLTVNKRFSISWKFRSAITFEGTATTEFDKHYVYHTSWAARCLAETKPAKHIDISSSLFFSGLCSAFIDIDFYDYRPADLKLSNLQCKAADLMQLPFETGSVKSLSCMHTVEHIGLGRYGDPLDPDGDLKAIEELKRVLAKDGNLFFVVPIGRPRIEFNAHRIYSPEQIISYFKDLELVKFSLISDKPGDLGLIENPSKELTDSQNYGCGCFWFTRKA